MNRKALLIVFLILFLFLSLCACAQQSPDPSPVESPTESQEPETLIIIATEAPETELPVTTPAPTPAPTAEPIEQRDAYIVSIEGTVYRSSPDADDGNILGYLSVGTRLFCEEEQGEFMLVEQENGTQVWINSWFLEAEDKALEAERDAARLRKLTGRDGFFSVEDEQTYYCTAASGLNCRAEPSISGEKLYLILQGTKVTVYGRENDFYLCRLPNGKLCYCYQDYLSSEATYSVYPGAVDLRVFLPGAEFDLLFASSNNITGHAMYAAIPILEEETAYKLLEAYQKFREDGYTIKIYDAYRPRSAQIELFNIVQDANYIADPYHGGSWHQRGWAVDMSLIDLATGEELKMPTPMHTFSKDANRMSRDQWPEDVQQNVDYMTEVMTSVGFGIIATEWWHFEYLQSNNALDPDIDLSTLPVYPVSSYATPY